MSRRQSAGARGHLTGPMQMWLELHGAVAMGEGGRTRVSGDGGGWRLEQLLLPG